MAVAMVVALIIKAIASRARSREEKSGAASAKS